MTGLNDTCALRARNQGSATAGISDGSFRSKTMEPDLWPLSSAKKYAGFWFQISKDFFDRRSQGSGFSSSVSSLGRYRNSQQHSHNLHLLMKKTGPTNINTGARSDFGFSARKSVGHCSSPQLESYRVYWHLARRLKSWTKDSRHPLQRGALVNYSLVQLAGCDGIGVVAG